MLQRFKRIVTQDQDLTNVQDNVQEVLQPFFTVPIYDGIYFDSISLNAGSNRLLHKLGRKYVGFILCNVKPSGGNPNTQYTNNWQSFTPTITGSGSMTWSTTSITTARYRLNGSTCEIQLGVTGTPVSSPQPCSSLLILLLFPSLEVHLPLVQSFADF